MDAELRAARKRSLPWVVLGLSIGYLLAMGRAWALDNGRVSAIVWLGGAVAEVLVAALVYFVIFPYRFRRRSRGV